MKEVYETNGNLKPFIKLKKMKAAHIFYLFAFLVCVFPVGTAHATPQAAIVNLAPHRAIYDMSLGEATAGSNISDIRGRLVFDFEGSGCAGYTLKSRMVNTACLDRRTWTSFSRSSPEPSKFALEVLSQCTIS